MPSAQEPTYLFKVMPETKKEFLTRDVDLLVSEIKENLRLSSLKAKSSVTQKHRPSPYLVPSRSEMRRIDEDRLKSKDKSEDDPYEKLMELLKQGKLINEAVKKLQTSNFGDLGDSEGEDEDFHGSRVYRRKDYYYDSEDEPLPDVYDPELV